MSQKWVTKPEELSTFNHIHPTEPNSVYLYIKTNEDYRQVICSLQENLHELDSNLIFLCRKRGAFINKKRTISINIKSNKLSNLKVYCINLYIKLMYKIFKIQIKWQRRRKNY